MDDYFCGVEKLIISFWPGTRNIMSKIWYNPNNKIHREDGPAKEEYHDDGINLFCQYWYLDGKLNRLPDASGYVGPALIEYRDDGVTKIHESWRKNGLMHRDPDIGPAWIKYYEDGVSIHIERYYYNGLPVKKNGIHEYIY